MFLITDGAAETIDLIDFSTNEVISISRNPQMDGTQLSFFCEYDPFVTVTGQEFTIRTAEATDEYRTEGKFDNGFKIDLYTSESYGSKLTADDQECVSKMCYIVYVNLNTTTIQIYITLFCYTT